MKALSHITYLQSSHDAFVFDSLVGFEFVKDPRERLDGSEKFTGDGVIRPFQLVRRHLRQTFHATMRDAVYVDLLWNVQPGKKKYL